MKKIDPCNSNLCKLFLQKRPETCETHICPSMFERVKGMCRININSSQFQLVKVSARIPETYSVVCHVITPRNKSSRSYDIRKRTMQQNRAKQLAEKFYRTASHHATFLSSLRRQRLCYTDAVFITAVRFYISPAPQLLG